jgi:hypothetical protein
MDVSLDLEAVGIALDDHVAESAFEQVPPAAVPMVERLRVPAVQTLETAAQRAGRELDEHVVVRLHEAVGEAGPPASLDLVVEDREKEPSVTLVAKDRQLVDAVLSDVVGETRELDAEPARHTSTVPAREAVRNESAAEVTQSFDLRGLTRV